MNSQNQPPGSVWLAHELSHDLQAAKAWGRSINYFNYRFVYPDELSAAGDLPASFAHNIERNADGFNHVNDYLLLSGDMVQICAIVSALASRFPYFHVLRYDRQVSGYIKIRINGHPRPAK